MHQSQQTLSLHLRLLNLAQALLVKVVQRNPQRNLKGKTTNPQMKKKKMMRKKSMRTTLLRNLQRKSLMRCVIQLELMRQTYAGKGEIVKTSQRAKSEI